MAKGGAGGQEVGRISIRVLPDTDEFRRQLETQLKEIEKSLSVTIPVNLDGSGVSAHMREIMAKLKTQAASGVDVKVNTKSASRTLANLSEGFSGAVSGVPAFSHGLLIAAAVASLVAPALALVSGALITMPTLITAALVPIAAIALGLDGIKEAAKTVEPQLNELKGVMSKSFQDRLTPIFGKLIDVFPTLNQAMPKVATGIGDMAEAFVDTIKSEKGLGNIRNTIGNIADAISRAAPGVASFTDGITTLISKVSDKLPNLADMFNGWGKSFENWVTSITSVDAFGFGSGVEGKTPLDRALHSFKETLQEILNLVGDLAKKGFDFLSDPQFGEKMRQFVEDIKTLINDVLPSLKNLFSDISDSVKGVNDALDKIKGIDPLILTKKDPFKSDLSSIAPQPSDELRKKHDLELQHSFEAMRQKAAEVWAEMSLIGAQYFANLTVLWAGLSRQATTTFNAVSTSATVAFASLLMNVVTVFAQIRNLFGAVSTSFITAWDVLPGLAAAVWARVVSAVQTALGQVVLAVATAGAQAVQEFIGFVLNVVSEASQLGAKVAAVTADFGGLLIAAGMALMDGLLKGISAGFEKVKTFVIGIAPWIAANKGPVSKDGALLTPAGLALMDGLDKGITKGFESVQKKITRMTDQIRDQMADGFEAASDAGIEGFKKNIDLGKSALDIPAGFARATGQQLAGDLGISGQGVLPQLLQQGVGLAEHFAQGALNIHVNSVDEALTVKDKEQQKKSMQYWRR